MKDNLILVGNDNNIKKASANLATNGNNIEYIVDQYSWIDELKRIKNRQTGKDYTVVVCSQNYLDIGKTLFDENISEYYVYLSGLLFRCDSKELMSPIELHLDNTYLKKRLDERTILYVGDDAIKKHDLAKYGTDANFTTLLLCTGSVPTVANELYGKCFSFTTMKGIQRFAESSDIDIVQFLPETNVFANLFLMFDIPVIYEVSVDNIKKLDLVLEYNVYKYCAGIVYKDNIAKAIYEKQFGIVEKPTIILNVGDIEDNDMKINATEMEEFYENVRRYSRKTI